MTQRIGFLISHPIQYYTPIFRELAKRCDLTVYYAHRQNAEQQGRAGFGIAFDWDIDLLSGYNSQFLTNIAREPSTGHFGGCNTPEIADIIANGRFDAFVVPGWSLRCYWQAQKACRRARVPILVRGDSQLVGPRSAALKLVKALAFSHVVSRFDGYLYVGRRNREYLEHYGAPADRLFFCPHCVDNEAFATGSEVARHEAGRQPGRRVLFVGRLIGDKRPLDLVRAMAQLAKTDDSLELLVVGAGELDSALREAVRAEGLKARFLGFVNQSRLPAVYASADAIVLPSSYETWGLVVNEAMACGVPAVVSDTVGCGPDLVVPGVTGEVFPVGHIGSLAGAIKAVLDFDPSKTRRSLMERMEIYSPSRAAESMVGAAATLAARKRV